MSKIAIIACFNVVLMSALAEEKADVLDLQAHPLYATQLYWKEGPMLSEELSEAGNTKERVDLLVFRITQFTAICSVNNLAHSAMPQASTFLNLLRSESRYDSVSFKMERMYAELDLAKFRKYLADVTETCDKVARVEYLSK